MSSSIRILVVDDDFATLEFLRSILALAQDDFEVLGVPTAEEALLELRHSAFHLLIADVRLPGMNGLELVRSAMEIRPDLPVIMITAYALYEMDQELKTLGVFASFRKPLDAEDFLEAVFTAVKTADPVVNQIAEQPIRLRLTSPAAVAQRLDSLRTDTGARQVIMATTKGDLLYVSGSQPEFDLRLVVEALTKSVNSGFRLANELNQAKPMIIQFLSGENCDVYFTNIDHDYIMAIFIDTQTHRGRIGTIWVFTQRAVRDIHRLLNDPEVTTPDHYEQPAGDQLSGRPAADGPTPPEEREDKSPAIEAVTAEDDMEPIVPAVNSTEEFSQEPPEKTTSPESHTDERLETMLTRLEGDENSIDPQDSLVNDFWEKAGLTDSGMVTPGLSLDEAREQGLIGPNFDIDED